MGKIKKRLAALGLIVTLGATMAVPASAKTRNSRDTIGKMAVNYVGSLAASSGASANNGDKLQPACNEGYSVGYNVSQGTNLGDPSNGVSYFCGYGSVNYSISRNYGTSYSASETVGMGYSEGFSYGYSVNKANVVKRKGLIYSIDRKRKTAAVIGGKNRKTVIIPNSVRIKRRTYKITSVSDGAFAGHTKIRNVIFGRNIRKIGTDAFAGCGKLKRITFRGRRSVRIDKNAFPSTVLYIGHPKNK